MSRPGDRAPCQLYITEIIFAEYQEVLQRPKFGHLEAEVVANLLTMIRRIGIVSSRAGVSRFLPMKTVTAFLSVPMPLERIT